MNDLFISSIILPFFIAVDSTGTTAKGVMDFVVYVEYCEEIIMKRVNNRLGELKETGREMLYTERDHCLIRFSILSPVTDYLACVAGGFVRAGLKKFWWRSRHSERGSREKNRFFSRFRPIPLAASPPRLLTPRDQNRQLRRLPTIW